MSGDHYLEELLRKYQVSRATAERAAKPVLNDVTAWGGSDIVQIVTSGSIEKGTGVKGATDIDYLVSLSSTLQTPLRDLYEGLYSALRSAGWTVRRQNVSLGVTAGSVHVDVVPGRRQSQSGNDHSLWRSRIGSWTKTNVSTHISYVRDSGRVDEIRIVKRWRDCHGLDFPSFYLELVVIEALRGRWRNQLAKNVLRALEYIRDDFMGATFVDPANPSKAVSDDLKVAERAVIAAQARRSLICDDWQKIVW